jgi:hypothetical protein
MTLIDLTVIKLAYIYIYEYVSYIRTQIFHVIARVKECQDAFLRAASHFLTRDAKYIDVDGGILRKYIILVKLYQFYHLNNKYR